MHHLLSLNASASHFYHSYYEQTIEVNGKMINLGVRHIHSVNLYSTKYAWIECVFILADIRSLASIGYAVRVGYSGIEA